MKIRLLLGILAGAFAITGYHATAAVQAPAAASAGVYTAEQARRGAALYGENCSSCHGDTLAGNDPIPALSGAAFQTNWKSVGELFDKNSTSMPAIAPGSLTGPQVADV